MEIHQPSGEIDSLKIQNSSGVVINPATEEKQTASNVLLATLNSIVTTNDKIHLLLSSILNADTVPMQVHYDEVNNATRILPVGGTVSVVTTVSTVTNQTNIGGSSADMLMENNSYQDWGLSIRSLII